MSAARSKAMEQKERTKDMRDCKLGVIGGDLRQLVMARALAERGFEVALFGIDTYTGDYGEITRCTEPASAVRGCRAVILPLPITNDGERLNCPLTKKTVSLPALFHLFEPGQLALGGRVTRPVERMAAKADIELIDYYEREELKISNAVPTAEGALAIAMSEVPYTIHGAKCLVVGYGRVGRAMARLLGGVGAEVTAAARRYEDLARIRADGYRTVRTERLAAVAGDFSIIFNTVPAEIFTKEVLSVIPPSVPIIDLASSPGGVDRDFAEKNGNHTVFALSLPGKTAPVTAGHIIEESVLNILHGKGVFCDGAR